jgi:large subunit ribosomal protein L25
MDMVEITIERRTGRRKGAARKARRTGDVPAIFYGPKRSTVSVTMKSEEFEKKLAHLEGSHLIRLLHGGQDPDLHDKAVLLREVQLHPVSGAVLHADFFEVDLTERLTVSVALHFVGKAAGVTDGGILQPIQREIEVECLPTEIPQYIEVDVTPLGIHEAVHLGEVKLPEGVTAVGDPSQALVTVLPPTVEEAKPTEAAEAAPTEGAAPEAAAAPAAGEGAPAEGKGKKGGGEG